MADIVIETLLNEKLEDGYSKNKNLDNFTVENELTVTITLAEYRNLIREVATKDKDIREANEAKWDRINKISALEKKVDELELLIFKYREKFGFFTDCNDESESEEK